jgi:transcriptional regulator with XRE-family HTH domain
MTRRPLDFRLHKERIALALDQSHLCHEGFASELGLSRQYWSMLFNGRRSVPPWIRTRLLANPRLAGIPEAELWEVRPASNERGA